MKYFSYPSNRYGIYLTIQNKFNKSNQNSNEYIICHAETYEINSDGSITFYQIQVIQNEQGEKKVKVPVLSYPAGKWENCAILADNNSFPVFSPQNQNVTNRNAQKQDLQQNQTGGQPPSSDPFTKNTSDDSFEQDLQAAFSQGGSNYKTQSHSNNSQPMPSMPGVTQNTEDFKKQKNEYLVNNIKEYIKSNTNMVVFETSEFLNYLNKDRESRNFKISDVDVQWTASTLIRERVFVQRKFNKPDIQKALDIVLPDMWKRHWNGKMSTMLEMLQEREETKNVTAIDVAVWMVRNNLK